MCVNVCVFSERIDKYVTCYAADTTYANIDSRPRETWRPGVPFFCARRIDCVHICSEVYTIGGKSMNVRIYLGAYGLAE